MSFIKKLWCDEAGFVVSSELVLIATVLVIGMAVGLTSLRDQVAQEVADLGRSISQVNESYSYAAVTGHTGSTAGSVFDDNDDFCDLDAVAPGGGELGLFSGGATDAAELE
jgi:hypothetical protein